ncbi:DNA-binding protein [Isoptericola sp. NEAU-Y5]|uniref:DNA-binding protein n=1 Tax=Isoptericola luteus TaxID=2879484 RepID=A0ABS7ZGR7_9MICO|nr:DNA-binding protein [Isoptericola sp. NEAU-Y5]MCA5894224.1 DNA-binding protein [Isoptericola sp. NEAU-Y5]
MDRKPEAAAPFDAPFDAQPDDQAAADAETQARRTLLALGADELTPRPWQPASVPPSATDLVRYYLWRSARGDLTADQDAAGALAALTLVPAARAEAGQLETAALFSARSAGHTWGRMAGALGLGSPQAVQQRLDRLVARSGSASPRDGA